MKKIATLMAIVVGVMLVSAPVASAAYTNDEAALIRASVSEVRVDLVNFAESYRVYDLLLKKIILDLSLLNAQFNQGQMTTDQAGTAIANIRTDVAAALAMKASIETSLTSIINKVNTIKVNYNTYVNN